MMDNRRHVPQWDGLRAIYIFLVSWYHIWQQSWLTPRIGNTSLDWLVRSGYVWVDGTVFLSAFLLFLPYARAMRTHAAPPDTRAFYFRRAKRILPGYYFILLLVFFAIALPWNLYTSAPYLVKDLATHFTFTFTFFYDTYVATPLGAACWTLAIEVQAYLLFPLVARAVMKRPVVTLGVLLLLCFGFRAWCLWALTDYTLVVNQLLNFLDVYVIGILAALCFPRLQEAMGRERPRVRRWGLEAAATAAFLLALWVLTRLLRMQAASQGYPQLQSHQMIFRPAYALCFAGLALSCPFALFPLRALLGNRLLSFLAGISMNYYLIHQTIIVHMKRIHFPASENDMPNMAGEQPWQTQYTLLAFGLSLLAAVLITYGIEKPASRWLDRRYGDRFKG